MKEKLIIELAKTICRSSVSDIYQGYCPHCSNKESDCVWLAFMPEAEAALTKVKEYARLSWRNYPKV